MSKLLLKFNVQEEELLRDFLFSQDISKKTLTRIKFDADGFIKVNGVEQNVRYRLSVGDVVELTLPSEDFNDNARFYKADLDIKYEDDYFLIVNKPSNMPTIPSRNEEDIALLDIVNYYFKNNDYQTIPHIVTRLDKNTTGLVLIAKHRHIHAQFSKLAIDKYYLALVEGKCLEEQIIEANIARTDDSIIVREVNPQGDYAKTQLFPEKYYENPAISLVRLKLFTGRTHQIRVHMSYLGYPLLGDELYGGNTKLISRQALHCTQLIFEHPITKKNINIVSYIPSDMANIIKK